MRSRKEEFKKIIDQSPDIRDDIVAGGRRTGATTGRCLELIGLAMKHPNQSFNISDYVPGYPELEYENSNLMRDVIPTINEIIDTLNLADIRINIADRTITYDLTYLTDL